MRLLKTLLMILFLCGTAPAFSQEVLPSDTLVYVRKLFQSNVYKNQIKLSKSAFASHLNASKKWSRKNSIANIILPGGPVVTLGGIYLAYDAIKGVPMVATIDGKEYPYVVRSLPKLLGGLALFVTGLSLVESANETKMNATRWYNEQYIQKYQKEKTAFEIKMGVTTSGGLGITANF